MSSAQLRFTKTLRTMTESQTSLEVADEDQCDSNYIKGIVTDDSKAALKVTSLDIEQRSLRFCHSS
jgi:hypothetical protein